MLPCLFLRLSPPGAALRAAQFILVRLFHGLFVGLDHFLNHLAAYGTGLLRSQIAIVALLQVNTNLSVRMFTY